MYKSVEGNQLIMVKSYKEVLFNKKHNRLYHHDLEDCYLVFVNMVEENREGFSCRELSGARDSMQALENFGYPSQKNFYHMVRTINNLPVSIDNVCNANNIFS